MPSNRPPESPPAQVAAGESHPESKEREAAWSRGRASVNGVRAEAGTRFDVSELAALSGPSFTDNVREYAMFVMDVDGIIRIWGESARLMKWWTKDEAKGGHLRLLYPDGGAEDGTAESHLQIAAASGEFTGEGHRVRSDGSTFWARVTVTALKEPGGPLRGFAKVVRDATGEGIAPDRLLPIFEPFEQAGDDVVREHGGTGLGLSISRRLARSMGGDLTVRSEVARGSAFFLWLPAADTRPANE